MSRTVSTGCVICAPDDGRLGSVDDIALLPLGPPWPGDSLDDATACRPPHNQSTWSSPVLGSRGGDEYAQGR